MTRQLMNMTQRLCDNRNPFGSAGVSHSDSEKQSLAWHARGKRIMQAVPCRQRLGNHPAFTQLALVGAAVGLLTLFLGFQIWRVVAPPRLSVISPTDGMVAVSPQVTVTGSTDPYTSVEINGQLVFGNADGTFSAPVELQQGANQLFIRATKKHGLFTTVSRTVMLNAPTEPSPVSVSPAGTSLAGT